MGLLQDRYQAFWESANKLDGEGQGFRQLPKDLRLLTLKANTEDHGEHDDHRSIYWALRRYEARLSDNREDFTAQGLLAECRVVLFGVRVMMEDASPWPYLQESDRLAAIVQVSGGMKGQSSVDFDPKITIALLHHMASSGGVEETEQTRHYARRLRRLPAFSDPMHNVWRWLTWPEEGSP